MSSNGLMTKPNIFTPPHISDSDRVGELTFSHRLHVKIESPLEFAFKYQGDDYIYVTNEANEETFTRILEDAQSRLRGDSNEPRVLPVLMTTEWLEEERARAIDRDLSTGHFQQKRSGIGMLRNVAESSKNTIAVFNADRLLIGTIGYAIKQDMTINAMRLYAPSGSHRKKGLSYAFIIWHALGLFARQTFGDWARVLIPYPMRTIYSKLLKLKCVFINITVPNEDGHGVMFSHREWSKIIPNIDKDWREWDNHFRSEMLEMMNEATLPDRYTNSFQMGALFNAVDLL